MCIGSWGKLIANYENPLQTENERIEKMRTGSYEAYWFNWTNTSTELSHRVVDLDQQKVNNIN
jgi:hypothetical protein